MCSAVRDVYMNHNTLKETLFTDFANRAANMRPKLEVTVCWAPNFAFMSDMSDPLDQWTLIAPLQAPAPTPHIALHIFPRPKLKWIILCSVANLEVVLVVRVPWMNQNTNQNSTIRCTSTALNIANHGTETNIYIYISNIPMYDTVSKSNPLTNHW